MNIAKTCSNSLLTIAPQRHWNWHQYFPCQKNAYRFYESPDAHTIAALRRLEPGMWFDKMFFHIFI